MRQWWVFLGIDYRLIPYVNKRESISHYPFRCSYTYSFPIEFCGTSPFKSFVTIATQYNLLSGIWECLRDPVRKDGMALDRRRSPDTVSLDDSKLDDGADNDPILPDIASLQRVGQPLS